MQLTIDLTTAKIDELNEANEIINRVINRRADKHQGKIVEVDISPTGGAVDEYVVSEEVQDFIKDITTDIELKPVEHSPSGVAIVDKHGRAWDERIDSNPATLTEKGEWRARRKPKDMSGVDWKHFCNNIKNPVEDEGKVSDTPSVFDTPDSVDSFFQPAANDTPATEAVDYDQFKGMVMDKIMNIEYPEFTPQYANLAATKHGVENIQAVKDQPELIPVMMMDLEL